MTKSETIPCTKEEMDRLIDASIDDDFAYTLFMVAKTTGRRIGEYYDVKVSDIMFDKGIMMTKILKKRRYVEKEAILTQEVSRILQQYIRRHKLNLNDYVFRKVSIRQIQNLVHTYARKAGIQHKVTFHNFRHYFITELYRKGWDYSRIAKLTGHTSIGTLAIYDHAVASDIKDEALKALEGI